MDFYQDVFGWKFATWEGPMEYWLISTGPESEPGINGGLAERGEGGAGTEITIEVDSVDELTAKIQANGGKVLRPKYAIPGEGWYANCEDSEGNKFGIMELDPAAQ
jgi:predicted enzyme related to lactoylglutathione lyase